MSARRILTSAGGAAIIFATTVYPATALAEDRFYIRAETGRTGSADANIQDNNFALDHGIVGTGGTAGVLANFGPAWLLGAGAGMIFSPHFRADIDYIYRGNFHLDERDEAVTPTNFHAKISSSSVMVNAYADFPILTSGVGTFVGVGIGWSQNTFGDLSATPNAALGGTRIAPGGTTDNFAWQLSLGISFPIPHNARMDIFYRYFDGGHMGTTAGDVTVDGKIIGTYSGAKGAFISDEFGIVLRFIIV